MKRTELLLELLQIGKKFGDVREVSMYECSAFIRVKILQEDGTLVEITANEEKAKNTEDDANVEELF